jgi:hypothetical protein
MLVRSKIRKNIMQFDDLSFENAARAVFFMNPSAQERYDSWEDLKSFMEGMAYQHMDDNTSYSTGGFQLTSFKISGGESKYVIASVSAYTANEFAKRMVRAGELLAA